MAAGGNNFNDFADSQLAKFRAVFYPAGCCKQWAVVLTMLLLFGLPELQNIIIFYFIFVILLLYRK